MSARLRPIRKHRPRCCDTCGNTYARCNKQHQWIVRNEGHRAGWQLIEVVQCMKCSTPAQSRRALMAAQVMWRPKA